MAEVEPNKLRLLKGTIQDNVDLVRDIRTKNSKRCKVVGRHWLWSPLLLAAVAYLLLPSPVVSIWQTEPMTTPAAGIDRPVTSATQEVSAYHAPSPAPRPLDRNVIPLGIKKIVIDPGHGGNQPGAISDSGIAEKDITLDIALRLRRIMETGPFEILMTRQSDRTVTVPRRVTFANTNRADLFISIHINWTEPREIRPLETYFVGPSDDPAIIKLASLENKESGYSLSEYRRVLEKIYVDIRRDESRSLAQNIHAELYRSLKEINPDLHDRGVKMAPFLVLVGTDMPAILVEVSTLSNEDEVQLLTNPEYREKIALALSRGIRGYANHFNGIARRGG